MNLRQLTTAYIKLATGFISPRLRLQAMLDLHPELTNQQHWTLGNEATQPQLNSNAALHNSSAWVYRCVDLWQKLIAPQLIKIVQDNETIKHPLDAILATPNVIHSSHKLWSQWALNMATGGESGIEVVYNKRGQLTELWPHSASAFGVLPNKDKENYYVPAGYRIYNPESAFSKALYDLNTDEFMHFKFHNPENGWRGMSPISIAKATIKTEIYANQWTLSYFLNGATPGIAIIAPSGLTPDEKKEIISSFQQRYGLSASGAGWHTPLVLEQGVSDIKPFSSLPKDMEWVNQQKLNRDTIGAIFGIPDEIAGHGRDTYENFDVAERVLWTITISSLIFMRDDELTFAFHKNGLLESDLKCQTDLTKIWALRRAMNSAFTQAQMLANIGVPFNRIDEYLSLGVGKIPGGDKPTRLSQPISSETTQPRASDETTSSETPQ